MTATLRGLTIANAIVYFAAAAYHTGVLSPASQILQATAVETVLGLVLVAAVMGIVRSPLIAYAIVLAGTLFGLTIVLLRGLLGVDLWIHVVMLAGLGAGFALIFGARGGSRST